MVTRIADDRHSWPEDEVRSARRDLVFALFGLGVLALLLPSPVAVLHLAAGRPTGVAGDGATAAALVVAAILVWTVLGLAAGITATALLARLPGRLGRCARVALGHLVPHRWRAWTGALIGVTLLAGTAGCGADSPGRAGDHRPPAASATIQTSVPVAPTPPEATAAGAGVLLRVDGLDWPTGGPVSVAEPPVGAAGQPSTPPVATPAPSTTASPNPHAATAHPASIPAATVQAGPGPQETTGTSPAAPDLAPPTPDAAHPPTRPSAALPAPVVITVATGDSLWTIAARQLPGGSGDGAIDASWRAWYAANRAVIGPDPDVILPGQRLRAPGTGVTP
jgi:LysM repeat protein